MTDRPNLLNSKIILEDAPGQIVAEWIKLLGVLGGVAITPFLLNTPFVTQRLPWLVDWFWVIGLAAGVLTIGAGIFYTARLARQLPKPAPPPGPVVDLEDRPHRFSLFTSPLAVHHESGWFPRGELPVLYLYWSRSSPAQPDRRSATEVSQLPPWITTLTVLPALITSIGLFILLPAIVALLLQAFRIDNPGMAAVYFSAPVILLWITAEGVAFYPYLQSRKRNLTWWFSLLKALFQIFAALWIWTYLGFSLGSHRMDWMLYTGAGLALLGTIFGTIAALANRRARQAPGEGRAAEVAQPGVTGTESGEEAIVQPKAGELAVSAEFQIFTGKDEQYYFRLVNSDGVIVLVSEAYKTLSGCQNGVRSVRVHAPQSSLFKLNTSADERYYFNLTARNRRVIGVSRMYADEAARTEAIAEIQAIAQQAELRDLRQQES